jgi:hypothetical protein
LASAEKRVAGFPAGARFSFYYAPTSKAAGFFPTEGNEVPIIDDFV